MPRRRTLPPYAPLPALLLCLGCAPAFVGYGPHFSALDSSVKTMGIVTSDISAYDVSAGGVYEYRVDWSRDEQARIGNAVAGVLAVKGMKSLPINDSLDDARLAGVTRMMRFHCGAIQRSLYGKNAFVVEIDSFDYSVGPIDTLCDSLGVDGLIVVYGADEHYSSERKEVLTTAAQAQTARSVAFGVLLGCLTGFATYQIYHAPPEHVFLSCIAVDRSGRVVWYRHLLQTKRSDMSTTEQAQEWAGTLFEGMHLKKAAEQRRTP